MPALEFFKDKERGVLDPKVFERAREVAEGLAKGKLKSSQFRNYFAELRALENRFERERRVEGEEVAFARLVPQLELLKAKLFYNTRSQGPLKEAREFVAFMEEALEAGKRSPKDFEAMMKYVEAVLAYFYALGK